MAIVTLPLGKTFARKASLARVQSDAGSSRVRPCANRRGHALGGARCVHPNPTDSGGP